MTARGVGPIELPARIGLITLACRDVERMIGLFRELGWQETPQSDRHHRAFQCTNGARSRSTRRERYEPAFGPPAGCFRAFTLCVNLESFEETWAVYEALRQVEDVELVDEPAEASWGAGFSWRDPEGRIWDVAWAKGTTFDDRGGVRFP